MLHLKTDYSRLAFSVSMQPTARCFPDNRYCFLYTKPHKMRFQEIMELLFLVHKITPPPDPPTGFLFKTHRLPAGTAVLSLPPGKEINLIKE